MCTGVAVRLGGNARKGFRLTAALVAWGRGLRWCQLSRGTVAWPRPMEHDAQPHQGDEYQLVEKEIRNHGKTPSYKGRNEGYPLKAGQCMTSATSHACTISLPRPRQGI